MKDKNFIDLASIRTSLDQDGGKRFWRSLDELGETDDYKRFANAEFPAPTKKADRFSLGAVSRRNMLKLMAASAGLAGLTACTKMPLQYIAPYVRPAEEFEPGHPLFYATAMPRPDGALGMLAKSNMGRPTKMEGNPDHPASLGKTDVWGQASVLQLWDPDRSQMVLRLGQNSDWSDVLDQIHQVRATFLSRNGEGLRFLTETITSPTFGSQMKAFFEQFPQAKWHQYEPVSPFAVREGARMVYGQYLTTSYNFAAASVVLSLDADFLCQGGAGVRYAHDFADARRVTDTKSTMNRLYVVESMSTITGATADHRLPVRSSDVENFTRVLAGSLNLNGLQSQGNPGAFPSDWISALTRELNDQRGKSIIIAGPHQPPIVHALAHAMNHELGNVGNTVFYTDPIEIQPVNEMQSLRELVGDMDAGQVDALVIIGGNPVYNAPADLHFQDALDKVNLRIHMGLYNDETAYRCHWHIPETHFLESWSDARAFDGTAGIVQPLIAPLYQNRSAHELLGALIGEEGRTPHEWVRGYWSSLNLTKPPEFETFWETVIAKGVIPNTKFPTKTVTPKAGFDTGKSVQPANGDAIEVVFRPDPTVWDGNFSNSAWLQELPKPLTTLTWDNAALISPKTAERFQLNHDDVIEISYEDQKLRIPCWILPGHADNSVTLHFGYGRTRAGHVGNGFGRNVYTIWNSKQPGFGVIQNLKKTNQTVHLVTTQNHHLVTQHGVKVEEESAAAFTRGIVRVATLEEYRADRFFAASPAEETTEAPSLYPAYDYSQGYQWGMSIDLNSCVGCNSCVTACYAENNVAVVGKEQVDNGRIMQWIRVDTYYRGNLENPESYHVVMPCMMCENAPCEYVCPVGATVHNNEGLNLMVYNRCVGTRYCSNNCPYKVRRFNFELWSDWTSPSLYGVRNPDVSVRSRGVMEKCTYCLQRIKEAEINSQVQHRSIREGEVRTACQQACPTQAIVFGNINDPKSAVSKQKGNDRNYALLADLNTRPRTTYLARLRNPNPEIKE